MSALPPRDRAAVARLLCVLAVTLAAGGGLCAAASLAAVETRRAGVR